MPVSREVHTFEAQGNFYGRQLFYRLLHLDVTNNLAAKAGGGQSGATTWITPGARFTTVASPGDSALLPLPVAPGLIQIVYNHGANAMDLFPQSGHNIVLVDGTDLGVDAALSMAAGSATKLISLSATTWLVHP